MKNIRLRSLFHSPHYFIRSLIFFALSTELIRCAPFTGNGSVAPLATQCSLPSDQTSTLTGQWPAIPIPLAFSQNTFNPTETTAITQAADTWNTFFQQTIGQSVFSYGTASSPNTSALPDPALSGGLTCPTNPAAPTQIIFQNNQFVGQVVIYKQANWPYSHGIIALTSSCYTGNAQTGANNGTSNLPKTNMSIIEINYQDFFVNGKPVPDLQTILTHELGHEAGIDHSCENPNKARTGMPDCTSGSLPAAYSAAVMFPSFSFFQDGTGQQKRLLTVNDESRALCLYSNTTPVASPSP